jgi:hypothetical protein
VSYSTATQPVSAHAIANFSRSSESHSLVDVLWHPLNVKCLICASTLYTACIDSMCTSLLTNRVISLVLFYPLTLWQVSFHWHELVHVASPQRHACCRHRDHAPRRQHLVLPPRVPRLRKHVGSGFGEPGDGWRVIHARPIGGYDIWWDPLIVQWGSCQQRTFVVDNDRRKHVTRYFHRWWCW